MLSRVSFSSTLVSREALPPRQSFVTPASVHFGKKSSPIKNTFTAFALSALVFGGGLTAIHSAIQGRLVCPWKSLRGDYDKEVPVIKPSVKAPELTQPLKKTE